MEFNEYQKAALSTAIYPEGISYPALGLAGETGEVCEAIKKILRDKQGVVDPLDRIHILKELGDVLWYISAIAKEFDLTLDNIAEYNISKLLDRKKRGVLGGSGNDR
jgi:NTP pyrophosphatase (non-canonical NTP hydrolase)